MVREVITYNKVVKDVRTFRSLGLLLKIVDASTHIKKAITAVAMARVNLFVLVVMMFSKTQSPIVTIVFLRGGMKEVTWYVLAAVVIKI